MAFCSYRAKMWLMSPSFRRFITVFLAILAAVLLVKPGIKLWRAYKKRQIDKLVNTFTEYERTRRSLRDAAATNEGLKGQLSREFVMRNPDGSTATITGRQIIELNNKKVLEYEPKQERLKRMLKRLQRSTGVDLSSRVFIHDYKLLEYGYIFGYYQEGAAQTPYLYKIDFDASKEFRLTLPDTQAAVMLCRSQMDGFNGIPRKGGMGGTAGLARLASVLIDLTILEKGCRDLSAIWPTTTKSYRKFKAGEKGWHPFYVAQYRANKAHLHNQNACLKSAIAATFHHEEQHIRDRESSLELSSSEMELRAYLRTLELHPLRALEELEGVAAEDAAISPHHVAATKVLEQLKREGLTRRQIHSLSPEELSKKARQLWQFWYPGKEKRVQRFFPQKTRKLKIAK